MAGSIGNQNAKGCEDSGRPLKYEPAAFKALFDNYIGECIENSKLANVIGFCVYADIDRETYYNYKDRIEFIGTLKRIEAILEDFSIQAANSARNPAFSIFYLKNKFGWIDKQEITQDVNLNNIKVKKPSFDEE